MLPSRIRGMYLRFFHSVRNAFKLCTICGQRGIQGLTYTRETCIDCAKIYQEALDTLGTTRRVENFIALHGRSDFLWTFGPTIPLVIEEEDNIPCNDIPCFDTFPGSVFSFPDKPLVPTKVAKFDGHPAQNCNTLDRARAMGPQTRWY